MAKATIDVMDDSVAILALRQDAYDKLEALARSKGMTLQEFLESLVEEGETVSESAENPQLLLG